MGIDPESARQLLAVAVPFYVLWFLTGIVIATLYHLSLYYLDGEYRVKPELSLDLLVGVLRGLAYVLVWPAIFYFDRTALYRIKMLFRYMDPKLREEDEELAGFIAEGRRRVRLRQETIERAALEERRAHEVLTGEEKKKHLLELHEGNPALDKIWLMMAQGSGPGGGREMVRMWEKKDLVEEVREKAKRELGTRLQESCETCGTVAPFDRVELPELLYVRVNEPESKKTIVEGWALRGNFAVTFHNCPECDTARLGRTDDITIFGRASDVVAQLKSGVSIHEDMPT